MTPHILNGAFERVQRAEKHLTDLRRKLSGLQPRQPPLPFEVNLDGVHKLPPNVILSVPISALIPILIGEICYNLRSALDYLVFELSKFDSGARQDGTQFPIEDSPKGFAHRVKTGRLKGVNSAHVAAIEGLQPYNGCDWTKVLRDISNPDKHREFAALGATLDIIIIAVEHPDFSEIQLPVQRAMNPLTLTEMDMKVHATGEILFADRAPVIETLEVIKLKVSETLAAFKLEFER